MNRSDSVVSARDSSPVHSLNIQRVGTRWVQGTDPLCLLVHSFWESVPAGDACVGPSLLDINECITGSHSCRLGENCINTVGSFRCQRDSSCGTGYELTEHNDCKGITCSVSNTLLSAVDNVMGKAAWAQCCCAPLWPAVLVKIYLLYLNAELMTMASWDF